MLTSALRLAFVLFGAVAWAQGFPDVDNQVPELRVTELLRSSGHLKVTFENISTKTIGGISVALGKNKIAPDWTSRPGGGLRPAESATVSVSTAGVRAGGTRHHAEAGAALEIRNGIFVDGSVSAPLTAAPVAGKVPAGAPVTEAPANRTSAAIPAPPPVTDAPRKLETRPTPVVAAAQQPAVKAAATPAERDNTPPPAAKKAPRPRGQTGTREQGRADELARLISLLTVYEGDLKDFPKPALRNMAAAVAAEQNEFAAPPPATPFEEGQLNALQNFAYGLQIIKDRRDLDDDAVREQVARFLKSQRQALAKP